MKVADVYLTGLGVLQPPSFDAREALAQGLYEQKLFDENQLTGVCVAGDISPPEMAVTAARHAYQRSGDDLSRLGLILHASVFLQGPEMWLPGYYIQRELVGSAIPAFEIRMGCNGMFAALELASARLPTLPDGQTILITSADNLESPLLNRYQTPGYLIGDAACAVVLDRRPGFAKLLSIGNSAVTELEPMHRGAEPLFPPQATSGRPIELATRVLHFMDTVMELPKAGELMVEGYRELVDATLAEAGVTLPEISRLVYGNAAGYFVEHMALKPLGLTLEQSTWHFGAGIGHTGASDQLLSLNHLLVTGAVRPGDKLLLAGGAPGFSLSCAVLEILEVPCWTC